MAHVPLWSCPRMCAAQSPLSLSDDVLSLQPCRSGSRRESCLPLTLSSTASQILSPAELERIGFTLAAYPFATLNPAIVGMRASLHALKSDGVEARATREQFGLPFEELQRLVGFPQYYEEESRYKANKK
eukprot:scaffold147278_cov35-Tisochrysis_lutea.AAC.2